MKINDLVKKIKNEDYKDANFIIILNEIANYVMYEQAIIKKDNNASGSTIKYRFEEKSYKYISEFFSEIEFLKKPIIGSRKKVIIKNIPKEYIYENRHSLSLNDKIYLLDKIKDSFMHLNDNNTLFELDFNENVVIIKNQELDYLLECKIPFSTLYKFNKCIKFVYDNSSPSLEWIDDFLYKKNKNYKQYKVKINNRSVNLYEVKNSSQRRIFYIPDTDYYYFFEKDEKQRGGLTKKEYDLYHLNSYVSLLNASRSDMNYPLLESIYDFDFYCRHSAYVSKMTSIINKIISFYNFIYNNIGYLSPQLLKKKILDFIYYTGQNGDENGLLVDICDINNMIIKKYMRNARSHANNKGVPNSNSGNETIIYYDVLYNSLQEKNSEKAIPSFALTGRRKELNKFFNQLIDSSLDNQNLYNQIINDLSLGKEESFELFLHQLYKFINQASKDKIQLADSLKEPIGNSNDFVDFIRKIMNHSFEYTDSKGNIKKIK